MTSKNIRQLKPSRFWIIPLCLSLVLVSAFGWLVTFEWTLGLIILAAYIMIVVTGLFIYLVVIDPLFALGIVLLLMPFHTIAENIIRLSGLSNNITLAFSVWKEGALLIIIMVILLRKITVNFKTVIRIPIEIVVLGVFILWGVFFIFFATDLKIALMEYRNLYEGILILIAVMLIKPPIARIFQVFNWMVAEGAFLSIWGFVSRYLFPYQSYLTRFGFVSPDLTADSFKYASVFSISGSLFLRANSIFSGPNEFGLYLSTLIVPLIGILLFNKTLEFRSRRWYFLALLLLGMGLFISISRSAWLLVGTAVLVMFVWIKGSRRKFQIGCLSILLLALIIGLIPNFRSFVLRTLNLDDTSAAGRVSLLDSGISAIVENPMGIGLGNASYKLIGLRGQDAKGLHTEFYIFIIALELGWVGLFLYLLTLITFVRRCSRFTRSIYHNEKRILSIIGVALLIGTLSSQFTSAITMEWIFQIYLWFFISAAIFGRSSDQLADIVNSR